MSRPRSYYTNHAKHSHYCSCGAVVYGNGGKAGHGYMHERRNDGHGFVTPTRYREMFPADPTEAPESDTYPEVGETTLDTINRHLAKRDPTEAPHG